MTLENLSPREREALTLYAKGHPRKVVADRMGVSIRTVEGHLGRVSRKLSRNLIQAVVLAAKGRLV